MHPATSPEPTHCITASHPKPAAHVAMSMVAATLAFGNLCTWKSRPYLRHLHSSTCLVHDLTQPRYSASPTTAADLLHVHNASVTIIACRLVAEVHELRLSIANLEAYSTYLRGHTQQ